MRKPKFLKERLDAPATLRLEKQTNRIVHEYACAHCGVRRSDPVDENSRLCRTVVCAACKERSFVYLVQKDQETAHCLYLLEWQRKLRKAYKHLRFFNNELYWRKK